MSELFDIRHKVIALTGGCGMLGSAMGLALAEHGATVAFLCFRSGLSKEMIQKLEACPGNYTVLKTNVLERAALEKVRDALLQQYGRVDALINGAGGNRPQATTDAEHPFARLPESAFMEVVNLNLMGTVLPSQVFSEAFTRQKEGTIINIASMASFRPLTRIPAYSAAKAAVTNFTHWLAVHLAQEYSPHIRVNAIAPGFFLTKQNRYLLQDEKGQWTERGRKIIEHTPMGRFGQPEELVGTVIWLLSHASAFVTGTVIPIDGGFSAFSGV